MRHIIIYFIYNKSLVEECDKEENVAVMDYYYFLFEKKIVKRFVQCLVSANSPPGLHPTDKYPVNTSHRSQIASGAVLFGISGNSYTVSTNSDICIYIHIFFTI